MLLKRMAAEHAAFAEARKHRSGSVKRRTQPISSHIVLTNQRQTPNTSQHQNAMKQKRTMIGPKLRKSCTIERVLALHSIAPTYTRPVGNLEARK
jgi:hypothetical protein